MSHYEEHLRRVRGGELRDLRHHWDDAYSVTWSQGRSFAARLDTGEMLTAETAEELRGKIAADYGARPVPRHLPPLIGPN